MSSPKIRRPDSSSEDQVSPLASQSFKEEIAQYGYQSQTQSSSPLKRKSLAPHVPSPFSIKRVTRSVSTATLRTAAIAKQKVFPPPVDLSPSPATLKLRAASTPSPVKTPPAKRVKSEQHPTSPSPMANLLTDALGPNLHILFVGVNPGLQTAATGNAYAHPSNRLYTLLYLSGITPQKCRPSEYKSLVDRYGVGFTNVVTRPTRDASMLTKKEMEDGVVPMEEKIRSCKPGCVVLVGKSVWETVARVWKREGRWKSDETFKYGWLDAWIGGDEEWEGARVFAATSTSGLAAAVPWEEKVRSWKELGDWYQKQIVENVENVSTNV